MRCIQNCKSLFIEGSNIRKYISGKRRQKTGKKIPEDFSRDHMLACLRRD